MFFVLSKTVGLLSSPLHFCAMLALVGWLVRRRWRRAGRVMMWTAAGLLFALSTQLANDALLAPLERRHARPANAPAPAAIVMLSGVLATRPAANYHFEDGADRFIETLRLAARYPGARVVFSGGSARLIGDKTHREAHVLAELAVDLGVAKSRILVESASRNTHENATHSLRLLRAVKGPIYVVTSASHMPRSLACFRRAGRDVVPWPVDYLQRNAITARAFLPKEGNLRRSTRAIHEYVGLAAYWLSGRI